MTNKIEKFLSNQLSVWQTARNNYEALKQVKIKELEINGAKFKVQFNPARIVSSGAKVDAKSIQERKCFLCKANRPEEQIEIPFETKNGGHTYSILVNPFPIFPRHFTIPAVEHVPQLIFLRFEDMLDLAEYMNDFVVFYNGPKCGASAPDHAHFQAGNKGFLPIEKEWRNHIAEKINENLFIVNYGFPMFVIETDDKQQATKLFEKIYNALLSYPRGEKVEGEVYSEPMLNIIAWYNNLNWVACIIPRAKHRPNYYYAGEPENILISPASVDLGGVFITPLEKDFEKINEKHISGILSEVCLNKIDFQEIVKDLY